MLSLKITDTYSIHRVVYDLFEVTRSESEKLSDLTSGIQYVERDIDDTKEILILSDRQPLTPKYGVLQTQSLPESFLNFESYKFEVEINPTYRDSKSKKTIPIKDYNEILQRFNSKSVSLYGFSANASSMQIGDMKVLCFQKKNHTVTLAKVKISGCLTVTDRELFIQCFKKGIGKGRAFGLGLLQLQPILQ